MAAGTQNFNSSKLKLQTLYLKQQNEDKLFEFLKDLLCFIFKYDLDFSCFEFPRFC